MIVLGLASYCRFCKLFAQYCICVSSYFINLYFVAAKDERAKMNIMEKAYAARGGNQGTSLADSIIKKPTGDGGGRSRKRKADTLDQETVEYYDSLFGLWIASSALPTSLVDNPNMARFCSALNDKVSSCDYVKLFSQGKVNYPTFEFQPSL